MSFLKLNQKNRTVQIGEVALDNPVMFSYFDALPAPEREEAFKRAVYIGVLALKEDRLSSFLAKTSNELGAQLESLKLIFDLKQELFFRSTAKGVIAETEIADYLTEFCLSRGFEDRVQLTGTSTGALKRNKTGDIICYVNGDEELKIALECKFDKSLRLGGIEKKDVFARKTDTAWSQLIEAQANRQASEGIIVFDRELAESNLLDQVENIKWIPGIGIIAIINSRRGDFSNLGIAYSIAREFVQSNRTRKIDYDVLNLIVRRIAKDVSDILEIKTLIEDNIATNQKILERIDKSVLSVEFSREVLLRFLRDGALTKEELLDFYEGTGQGDALKLMQASVKKA